MTLRTTTPVAPSKLMLLVIAFIVWSVAFVALYGLNAVGCAFGWNPATQRIVLVALFFVHLGLLAGFSVWTWKRWRAAEADRGAVAPSRLLEYVGIGTGLAALGATVFSFFPVFALSMCV